MAEGAQPQRPVVENLNRKTFHSTLTKDNDGTAWLDTGWDVDGDADEVWRWFREPDKLARWSPMVPDQALDLVGPVTMRENPADEPVAAEVVEIDDGRRWLEIHTGGSTLRWWVRHVVDGLTNVELRQSVADPSEAASTAAGWAICLSVLGAIHQGHDVDRVVGKDALAYGWERIRDEYARNVDRV